MFADPFDDDDERRPPPGAGGPRRRRRGAPAVREQRGRLAAEAAGAPRPRRDGRQRRRQRAWPATPRCWPPAPTPRRTSASASDADRTHAGPGSRRGRRHGPRLAPMSTEGGTKAVVAALLANTGIAVTKFLAFVLTGASSMLAEAIHSVADSGNQVLLLLGGKRVRARGHRRSTRSASAASATSTRSSSPSCCSRVGGLFALYEAYHKCHEVHEGKPNELLEGRWWWVPVVVLVGAIVHGGPVLPHRDPRDQQDPRGAPPGSQFIRRAKSPELPVILLEDFAALIGLVLRAARRRACPCSPATATSTSPAPRSSACCWSPSRSCSPSRPRACCSASPPARRRSARIDERAATAPPASSGSST